MPLPKLQTLSLLLLPLYIVVYGSLGHADIAFVPVDLKNESSKIESSIAREAGSHFAEEIKNCQALEPVTSYKKRINTDLLSLSVRLKWADASCNSRLPKGCHAVYSMTQGLVDLTCSEGDNSWQ